MKYNMSARVMGAFYHSACKKVYREQGIEPSRVKAVKREFRAVIDRAKDIGASNLLGSYIMAAYFIAMNRETGLDADANYEILKKGLMASKMFKGMMGDAESYFDPKRTEKRKIWSKESHERKYENDWVVDILDKTDSYELGYNYHECGVCKLCRDEGVFELAKYLCHLDFPIAEMMGMRLDRTKTLAEGGDMCDFRYSYGNDKK